MDVVREYIHQAGFHEFMAIKFYKRGDYESAVVHIKDAIKCLDAVRRYLEEREEDVKSEG